MTSGEMTEPRAEKECPFCCERIDARARRCPHCRMQQTRWAILLHRGFLVAGLVAILGMFAWLIAAMYSSFPKAGAPPVANPPRLVVTDTRLSVEQGAKGPLAVIAGTLSNKGKTAWYGVDLQGTVTDKDGKLADVLETSVDSLPAGAQRIFRMGGPALLPADRYVNCSVGVASARRSD
jgi:hypothetical protein